MPTNLNALIRYKQIDSCLKNTYIDSTIEKLRDVCTEALGEHRGIYKKVSKRTIQEDIRVLRSSILGFNAPIVFSDGKYEYSDKEYSIFSTPITEIRLLKEILKLLLAERKKLGDAEIDSLIERIAAITGEPVKMVGKQKQEMGENREPETPYEPRVLFSLAPKSIEEDEFKTSKAIAWSDVFDVLDKADVKKRKFMERVFGLF